MERPTTWIAKRVFHDEAPQGCEPPCGADITKACAQFTHRVVQPQMQGGRLLLVELVEHVITKPMICPACDRPMVFEAAPHAIITADRLPQTVGMPS